MDICNGERFANALPALKMEIFGKVRQEKEGEGERGRKREGVGHRPPHLSDKTQKHEHFYFTPTFCEVVILIRFELAHSTAAGDAA